MKQDEATEPFEYTEGDWAWQKFGNYYMLAAQHGMREIILGALVPDQGPSPECYVAMNKNGRLRPIDPSHPNARIIAKSGRLYAALKRLSFAAQTSGGTAGPDEELMAAIKEAGDVLMEINKQ